MFEVVANLIKALFGDEVLAVGTEITAVDDSVDEVVGVGTEGAALRDAANALEAEGIPDAAGGDISFVDEVEDRVGVSLEVGSVTRCKELRMLRR